MMLRALVSLTLSLPIITVADLIPLVTFGTNPDTDNFEFIELNDPVMGGQSTGTWEVNSTGNFGIFDGEVKDVPSLSAPGFIKTAADGDFADVSAALGGYLVLSVRSSTADYQGYRVSFAAGTSSPSYACSGGGSLPFSSGCFKAPFAFPSSSANDFTAIRVPFSSFSDHWDPATGDQTKTCEDDSSVCPTATDLAGIKRMEIWAEGVDGLVHLELDSISAEPTSVATAVLTSVGAAPPSDEDICSGLVQTDLKYGISGRTTADGVPLVDANESLAEAVCCDARALAGAEPMFTFDAPDIDLFSKIDGANVTFFDSVCGIPVFVAAVDRPLSDFEADTREHGWPAFRTGEVVLENVVTNYDTGLVYSSCGTHLGSYEPDDEGPRWCIDISCIAGNES